MCEGMRDMCDACMLENSSVEACKCPAFMTDKISDRRARPGRISLFLFMHVTESKKRRACVQKRSVFISSSAAQLAVGG